MLSSCYIIIVNPKTDRSFHSDLCSADPSVILYVKQICAGALSTVNNSTDADGECEQNAIIVKNNSHSTVCI